MVQLLELENGNIIMFNDENIKEEEVIETFEMGEYSSRFIVMTKNNMKIFLNLKILLSRRYHYEILSWNILFKSIKDY